MKTVWKLIWLMSTTQGSLTFETGNILGNKLNRAVKVLEGSGSVCVMIEREQEQKNEKSLSLRLGVELHKEARVFYEIERELKCDGEDSSWQPICRSDYEMDKVKSYQWSENTITIPEENTPNLRITLRSHSTKMGNILIGYVETSVNRLFQTMQDDEYLELDWCAPKSSGKNGINLIKVISISTIAGDVINANESSKRRDGQLNGGLEPTFINYITGACTLNLFVAIDFTAANGDARKEESLHYIHGHGILNDYESAIFSIGEVVAKYDSDQVSCFCSVHQDWK